MNEPADSLLGQELARCRAIGFEREPLVTPGGLMRLLHVIVLATLFTYGHVAVLGVVRAIFY